MIRTIYISRTSFASMTKTWPCSRRCSPAIDPIFAIVCESGKTDLGIWIAENRNVETDFERAFGRPAPHVKGLRIQINSQHTGTSAESYFGGVEFLSAQR